MPPYTPKNKNLPFYLHLALFTCTKLIVSTLRSVGTPAHYLHTTYTKLHTAYTKLHTQLHTTCTTKNLCHAHSATITPPAHVSIGSAKNR